jgi:hypothetical protein
MKKEEISLAGKSFRQARILSKVLDHCIKNCDEKVKVTKRADRYIYEFENLIINLVPLWEVTGKGHPLGYY